MRMWLLRLQSVLMRGIGVRRLRQALDIKSDAIHSDLVTRFDMLRAEIAERDRLAAERVEGLQRRLDGLGGQLSAQGQADTERGDTVQNTLRDLRAAVGDLGGQLSAQGQADTERGDAVQNTLRDLRAAVGDLGGQLSAQGQADTERGDTVQNMLRDLRAAFGELHRSADRGGSFELMLGEFRAEISGLRADFARDLELRDERLTCRGDGSSLIARAS